MLYPAGFRCELAAIVSLLCVCKGIQISRSLFNVLHHVCYCFGFDLICFRFGLDLHFAFAFQIINVKGSTDERPLRFFVQIHVSHIGHYQMGLFVA